MRKEHPGRVDMRGDENALQPLLGRLTGTSMASIEMEELPSAVPATESWLLNSLGDDNPLGL